MLTAESARDIALAPSQARYESCIKKIERSVCEEADKGFTYVRSKIKCSFPCLLRLCNYFEDLGYHVKRYTSEKSDHILELYWDSKD